MRAPTLLHATSNRIVRCVFVILAIIVMASPLHSNRLAIAQVREEAGEGDVPPFAIPSNWKLEKIDRIGDRSYTATLVIYEGDAKRASLVLIVGQKSINAIPTESRGQIGLFAGAAAAMETMELALSNFNGTSKVAISGTGSVEITGDGVELPPEKQAGAVAHSMISVKSGTEVVAALATKPDQWEGLESNLPLFVKLAKEAKVYRKWTSADGKYTTEAEFIKFEKSQVHLGKRDGSVILLGMSKLSKADQQYIRDLLRK